MGVMSVAGKVASHRHTCLCPMQDMERQALNVFRMRLMGAEVRPVYSGTATLKDATSEAIRDWVCGMHAVFGSLVGPTGLAAGALGTRLRQRQPIHPLRMSNRGPCCICTLFWPV